MDFPEKLLYAKSHEWVEFLSDTECKVGITDYAQAKMGDIVFVNLPEAGDEVEAGGTLTDIESVKAVADVYCPVTGKIEAANEALDDQPELLNASPYEAWIAKITDVTGREELMDAAAYRAFCEAEEE